MVRWIAAALLSTVALGGAPAAGETVDLDMVTRIRDEGFRRSQVMETMRQLTDVNGPRLTGSPGMMRANEWTRDRLAEWGLSADLESYEFGRGWSFAGTTVQMNEPRGMPLLALPKAWTPGTDGPVSGTLMQTAIESMDDIEEYRGKLAGKFLLLGDPHEFEADLEPDFERYTDSGLTELVEFRLPGSGERDWRKGFIKRWRLRRALAGFFAEEGVLGTIEVSSRDAGVIRVAGGGSYRVDEDPGVPALVMSAEHYNYLHRLLSAETPVTLTVDVSAEFYDDDTRAYNTVAEIPGTGDELVMVGAHLDSWHAGTGATDNAAGCAVAMEAVRILAALGIEPRRTIRIALWSGEEQGLQGSKAYVKQHFAFRQPEEDADAEQEVEELPDFMQRDRGPLQLLEGHARLSAYFNLDNGSGRIRGIYAEENAAIRPIFESWLAPLHDLGATTVTLNRTGGTDHRTFDRVGLPGFQFIQDGLTYSSLTHHTNLDVLDHVEEDDLRQASVVLAVFLYHAAMRDELLPRKPLPPDPED